MERCCTATSQASSADRVFALCVQPSSIGIFPIVSRMSALHLSVGLLDLQMRGATSTEQRLLTGGVAQGQR